MDIAKALGKMGIAEVLSKEGVMQKLGTVEFTLKGVKHISSFDSPKTADRFISEARKKWGSDFQTAATVGPDFSQPNSGHVTSDKSYIQSEKPEHVKSANRWLILQMREKADKEQEEKKEKAGEDKEEEVEKMNESKAATEKKSNSYKSRMARFNEGNQSPTWEQGTNSYAARYRIEYGGGEGELEVKADTLQQAREKAEAILRVNEHGAATITGITRTAAEEGEKTAGFNFFFPGQALREFYPELQHEIVDYPNSTNSTMTSDITGDAEAVPKLIAAAFDDAIDGLTKISYVSTSPAGANFGQDFKSQTDQPGQFLKEDELRGPGRFGEEYYQNSDFGPGGDALSYLASPKTGAGLGDKEKLGEFLKRVVAEIAVTFISAFKLTSRPPLDKVPGTGEVQLDQIEQQQTQGMSSLSLNITESRVKKLVSGLNDGEVQECLNDSWAQAAVWCGSPQGGFVYEVFVRAETLDQESLVLKYRFVTGTRE